MFKTLAEHVVPFTAAMVNLKLLISPKLSHEIQETNI